MSLTYVRRLQGAPVYFDSRHAMWATYEILVQGLHNDQNEETGRLKAHDHLLKRNGKVFGAILVGDVDAAPEKVPSPVGRRQIESIDTFNSSASSLPALPMGEKTDPLANNTSLGGNIIDLTASQNVSVTVQEVGSTIHPPMNVANGIFSFLRQFLDKKYDLPATQTTTPSTPIHVEVDHGLFVLFTLEKK